MRALNAFMHDLYHRQEIIRSGRLPERLFRNNEAWLPQMVGFTPPGGVYTHIVGIDLVRTGPDEFLVLEDNARTPSGVSYMLENRETMMAMFPELFSKIQVQPVSNYPRRLAKSLAACAPDCAGQNPTIAVLTPGIFNSAYFEHAFLADQMGAELVEGSDLRVIDGRVQMRTTSGFQPIDVLYRRVDDEFLDPLTFNPDSVLGVPGIFDVYRAGQHHHRQRAGHRHRRRQGDLFLHARDRGVLHRRGAAAAQCRDLALRRSRQPEIRARQPGRAGGQGSPRFGRLRHADRPDGEQEGDRRLPRTSCRPGRTTTSPSRRSRCRPARSLPRPGLAPRHVDLRPFVLVSPEGVDITPGGLTRVALKKGSLVVNSSQGGGTKDSWVLND